MVGHRPILDVAEIFEGRAALIAPVQRSLADAVPPGDDVVAFKGNVADGDALWVGLLAAFVERLVSGGVVHWCHPVA